MVQAESYVKSAVAPGSHRDPTVVKFAQQFIGQVQPGFALPIKCDSEDEAKWIAGGMRMALRGLFTDDARRSQNVTVRVELDRGDKSRVLVHKFPGYRPPVKRPRRETAAASA